MNRITTVTLAPAAASANNIAQSQTPGGAGNLTLNGSAVSGGVATLDIPRRVLLTTAADETARTFTITGTDRFGRAMTEVLAGVNNTTASTTNDFKTVTQIAVDDATAGAVTVGTGGKVSSQWLPVDRKKSVNLGFAVKVTGTINYTVEYTRDDPFTAGVGVQPAGGVVTPVLTPFPHSVVASKTANFDGDFIGQPITAVRVSVNSYSTGGQVVAVFDPGAILAVV